MIKKKPLESAVFINSVFISLSGFNSGDDLLFRGLSQSTIGDTVFPCLVRNGTEGCIRSIITRIKSSKHIVNQILRLSRIFQRSLQAFRLKNQTKDKKSMVRLVMVS